MSRLINIAPGEYYHIYNRGVGKKNNFHILVKENKTGGISKYLHRVLTAYTMYYNIRNETSGHLFQGPYKIVHIQDDRQLMHTSAYIHRNTLELGWKLANLHNYKWSSYSDYIGDNRWGDCIERSILLDRFTKKENDTYKYFI